MSKTVDAVESGVDSGVSTRWDRFDPFKFLSVLIIAGISLLIAYPLGRAAIRLITAGEFGAAHPVVQAYRAPSVAELLWQTSLVVVGGTIGALILGAVFAWVNERTDARMGFITDVLPILPLLVPPIAGAIGWVILASPHAGFLNALIRRSLSVVGVDLVTGPLNIFSWHGVVFVYTLYLVPHVYLSAAAGLRNMDTSLEEASRVSGVGPVKTLWKVTLPAIKPSLVSGALLAGIYAVAMFSVPAILGTQADVNVLSVRIVRMMTFSFPPETERAMALGLVIVVVLLAGQWGQRRVLGREHHVTLSGKGHRVTTVRLGRWRPVLRLLMLGYLLVTTVLPFVGLLIVSVQPFWTANIDLSLLSLDAYSRVLGTSGNLRSAFTNSFSLGIVGASISVLIASILAYSIRVKQSRVIGAGADYITKLPGAVSNIIVGIAFVIAFVGPPFNLAGTLLLLFLAYLVLYMPQATLSAGSALGQIGTELLEASRVSGATEGKTFRRVALPLMAPGLVSGWALVFVLTAGDITASVLLAGTQNPVVGFVVLDLWNTGTFPTLAAISVLISVVTTGVVLSAVTYVKRRERAWRGT